MKFIFNPKSKHNILKSARRTVRTKFVAEASPRKEGRRRQVSLSCLPIGEGPKGAKELVRSVGRVITRLSGAWHGAVQDIGFCGSKLDDGDEKVGFEFTINFSCGVPQFLTMAHPSTDLESVMIGLRESGCKCGIFYQL